MSNGDSLNDASVRASALARNLLEQAQRTPVTIARAVELAGVAVSLLLVIVKRLDRLEVQAPSPPITAEARSAVLEELALIMTSTGELDGILEACADRLAGECTDAAQETRIKAAQAWAMRVAETANQVRRKRGLQVEHLAKKGGV